MCLEKRLRPGVSQAACGGPSTLQPRLLRVLTSRPCSLFPGTHLSRLEFETQSPVYRDLDLPPDREARGQLHPTQRPPRQRKALNSMSLWVTRESGSPSCSCHKGAALPRPLTALANLTAMSSCSLSPKVHTGPGGAGVAGGGGCTVRWMDPSPGGRGRKGKTQAPLSPVTAHGSPRQAVTV